MTAPPSPASASSSFPPLLPRPSHPVTSPSLLPPRTSLTGLPEVHPGTSLSLASPDPVPHILMALGDTRIEFMGLWRNGEHPLAVEGTQDTSPRHGRREAVAGCFPWIPASFALDARGRCDTRQGLDHLILSCS
ncbi:hypothetical protein LY76DRAFT_376358 [Colletotrichum caudatum]|nr:hypothetical protein LY76DRAFT_376358 [Colletotrichum caudatum]